MFELLTVTKNLSDNKLLITYSILLPGQDPIPNYLIGDSAYPITPYSMEENTRAVLITYSIILPGQDPIPNYLIGDSVYPLTPYSMEENTRAVLVTLKLSSIIYYEAQGIKLNVHLED